MTPLNWDARDRVRHLMAAMSGTKNITAEARYVKALERHLGGHDAVAECLHQIMTLEESDGSEVGPEKVALVNRWAKAANAARQAGYQGLSEVEGAYFEVQPV